MEYLETIAEDVSWFILEQWSDLDLECTTQQEIKEKLFTFLKNQ